jgi:hypothetical protein
MGIPHEKSFCFPAVVNPLSDEFDYKPEGVISLQHREKEILIFKILTYDFLWTSRDSIP